MNTDLKNFIQPIARVVAASLFVVCTVAFVTVPYVLGQHPGDAVVDAHQSGPRHMT